MRPLEVRSLVMSPLVLRSIVARCFVVNNIVVRHFVVRLLVVNNIIVRHFVVRLLVMDHIVVRLLVVRLLVVRLLVVRLGPVVMILRVVLRVTKLERLRRVIEVEVRFVPSDNVLVFSVVKVFLIGVQVGQEHLPVLVRPFFLVPFVVSPHVFILDCVVQVNVDALIELVVFVRKVT